MKNRAEIKMDATECRRLIYNLNAGAINCFSITAQFRNRHVRLDRYSFDECCRIDSLNWRLAQVLD